ncbi:MAG: redoxin domain-containing protein [Phycisphaerae bacterium]|nr:redoxin domain-containing protein [Phycisphaerae bacterium]
MNTIIKTTLLAATLVAATVIAQPAGMDGKPPKKDKDEVVAKIGELAPKFTLEDQWGTTHTLDEYEGKIVVLEWFTDTCPYSKRLWGSGLASKMINQLGEMDVEVVYLAVNSTGNRPQEEIVENGTKFFEDLEVGTPMLIDHDGEVGHAYGAKTTPHMFVIDVEGVLAYHGALSNDPRGKEDIDAETHILRAVTQLQNEEEVKPNYIKPWGCSIKYGKGGDKEKKQGRRKPKRGPGVMGMP